MIGQAFVCPRCNRLRAAQDGFALSFLTSWSPDSALEPGWTLTTNSTLVAKVHLIPAIVCGDCIPEGVDATPLGGIGLRP